MKTHKLFNRFHQRIKFIWKTLTIYQKSFVLKICKADRNVRKILINFINFHLDLERLAYVWTLIVNIYITTCWNSLFKSHLSYANKMKGNNNNKMFTTTTMWTRGSPITSEIFKSYGTKTRPPTEFRNLNYENFFFNHIVYK